MKEKAKARDLTGAGWAEKNANTRNRCGVVEVYRQEEQDVIVVIPSTPPM